LILFNISAAVLSEDRTFISLFLSLTLSCPNEVKDVCMVNLSILRSFANLIISSISLMLCCTRTHHIFIFVSLNKAFRSSTAISIFSKTLLNKSFPRIFSYVFLLGVSRLKDNCESRFLNNVFIFSLSNIVPFVLIYVSICLLLAYSTILKTSSFKKGSPIPCNFTLIKKGFLSSISLKSEKLKLGSFDLSQPGT